MKLEGRLPFRVVVSASLLTAKLVMAATSIDGLSQAYCSYENTGSDYLPQDSIYMSMGKCFDQCKTDYAFAVVQYKSCWCSNYIPNTQEDVSQCSQQCPGYPDNQCGNADAGLFGYIPLYKPPSGTAGAPASTQPASSSPPPQTSYEPVTTYVSRTVTQTVTNDETQGPRVVTSYVTPTPLTSSIPMTSSSGSSSSSSSSDPPTTSSAKASRVTSVRVTTVSGSIVTQTVTETPTSVIVAPSNASDSVQMHRKGMSGGAIAGIVLGTLIGLAALLLAAFLLWRRRRDSDPEGAGATTRSPKRNISVLSKTGLLARGRPQSMAENTYEDPPVYTANTGVNSVRHSMMFGAGAAMEGVSPVSPLGGSQDNVSSRRHSKPMVYDQRLNPSALFANPDANNSRVSMQDQQDYSRPLGITNPDWRASFDSR